LNVEGSNVTWFNQIAWTAQCKRLFDYRADSWERGATLDGDSTGSCPGTGREGCVVARATLMWEELASSRPILKKFDIDYANFLCYNQNDHCKPALVVKSLAASLTIYRFQLIKSL